MVTNLHIVKIGAYNKVHKARENKSQKQKRKRKGDRKMKKNELEKIMNAERAAWEKLCERRWVVLVNSDMPRGCGYKAACEYIDGKDERELATWYALHELNSELGITVPATDYAMSCQTKFFRYAENR